MKTKQKERILFSDQLKLELISKIKLQIGSKTRKEKKIKRVSINIPHLDLVAWLKNQRNPIQFYFEDHTTKKQRACVGSIKQIQAKSLEAPHLTELIQDINEQPDLCYIARMPCLEENKNDKIWDSQDYEFYVPLIQIEQNQHQTSLHCYFEGEETINLKQLDSILDPISFSESESTVNTNKNSIIDIIHYPKLEEWTKKVNTIKDHIRKGHVEKVVLSRRVDAESNTKIEGYKGLAELRKQRESGFTFMNKTNKNVVFLGSSPELLYHRENRKIKSIALAGTLKNSPSNKNQLLNDPKEVQEHHFVKSWVEEQLRKICNYIKVEPNTKIVSHDYVQHIYSDVIGELSHHVTDLTILKSLHPTPAIGGFPAAEAKELIKKLEPFSRGYFAGVIGFISQQQTQFAVSIRSALIKENKIHFFSGAGIVKESEPKKEWQELNLKIQFLWDLLFD